MYIVLNPNRENIHITAFPAEGQPLRVVLDVDRVLNDEIDFHRYISQLLKTSKMKAEKIQAIGIYLHFGGGIFGTMEVFNEAFLEKLNQLMGISPIYTWFALSLFQKLSQQLQSENVYVFFGTGYFLQLPEQARRYAISISPVVGTELTRYGYHGLYHKMNGEIPVLPNKVISIVLGKKTTVSAIINKNPLTISMGFTPLEGIMGERNCGDIDPGIIMYLMNQGKYSIYHIDEILKNESGFFGLTGLDLSIPDLLPLIDTKPKVALAFDIYREQIRKYCGEAILQLGGFTDLVISGEYAARLIPFIYQFIKEFSFLDVHLKGMPWVESSTHITEITESSSRIRIHLNLYQLDEIIYEELQKPSQTQPFDS